MTALRLSINLANSCRIKYSLLTFRRRIFSAPFLFILLHFNPDSIAGQVELWRVKPPEVLTFVQGQ